MCKLPDALPSPSFPPCHACSYRCLGPGYFWIRFGAPYNGYTSTNAGLKAPVYVQSTW